MRVGLLLAVFSLVACAAAERRRLVDAGCPFVDVPRDKSGSLSYYFPEETGPGTVNCSTVPNPRCNASINNAFLADRSWYITQDKSYYGAGYNPWWFQLYNIQCPETYFLHLTMQQLALNCTTGTPQDSVRVNTSRFDTGELCTQESLEMSELYNGGLGVFIEDGRADITFCSNGEGEAAGFVLRATCINPIRHNEPGCVSFEYWAAWDPLFVDIIRAMFEIVPTTLVPHKRSADERSRLFESMKETINEFSAIETEVKEEQESIGRVKRSVPVQRIFFEFEEGTTITYIDSELKFTFPNETMRTITVFCLVASNDLYGTRYYFRNATRQIGDQTGATEITFTGPGYVDVHYGSGGPIGQLKWTPQPSFEEFLEMDIEQCRIAERIYSYINDFWISPYPTIDELAIENLDPKPFPLFDQNARGFSTRIRRPGQVGAIFPEIQKDSICRPVIRLDVAPLLNGTIDQDLFRFCSFFQFACNVKLQVACREIMFLDPYDTDPLSMMMMGGGDR